MTYLAQLVIMFKQHEHSLDGLEALIHLAILLVGVQNVWRHDRGQVVRIHLAACIFIDLREAGDPGQEQEEHLERVAMCLGQQTARKV